MAPLLLSEEGGKGGEQRGLRQLKCSTLAPPQLAALCAAVGQSTSLRGLWLGMNTLDPRTALQLAAG